MNKPRQYIRNFGLALNQFTCFVIGKDPRMTISAVAWLHQFHWLIWLANAIYRNPNHCREAARGWDTPAWQKNDRSLWKPKGLADA